MSIRVFPAACSICFPPSWFVPSSVGFLPHLSLAVVGRRCQVKVVALAFSTCSPVAVAMLCFFFGSILFGSARS
ncbi:hypothetical protein GQ42DRAFT_161263 [Ramicandelaber brevisporus]|nr:hypothetical protein GQ42DRAFT_161263 [Ramicandelaber brevisporus]